MNNSDEEFVKNQMIHWGLSYDIVQKFRERCENQQEVHDYLSERLKTESHAAYVIHRLLYEVALLVEDPNEASLTAKMLIEDHKAESAVPYELKLTARQLFRCKLNREMTSFLRKRCWAPFLDNDVVFWVPDRANSRYVRNERNLIDYCSEHAEFSKYVPNLKQLDAEERTEDQTLARLNALSFDTEKLLRPKHAKPDEETSINTVGRQPVLHLRRGTERRHLFQQEVSIFCPTFNESLFVPSIPIGLPNNPNYRETLSRKRIMFCSLIKNAIYAVDSVRKPSSKRLCRILIVSTDRFGFHIAKTRMCDVRFVHICLNFIPSVMYHLVSQDLAKYKRLLQP